MGDVEMKLGAKATKKNDALPRNAQNGGSVQKPKFKKGKNNLSMVKRLVAPKSPLMVLNEMVNSESGGMVYTFGEQPTSTDPRVPPMYVAEAVHNGKTFTGRGPNKIIAKNICAEQIIQFIVTNKCNDNQAKESTDETIHEDETPWANLASLAIYKLFNDWQAQGFDVPPELMSCQPVMEQFQMMPRGPPRPGPAQMDFTSEAGTFHDFTQPGTFQQSPCKQMPANPTEKHPVQLLNELRGTTTYELKEVDGDLPNCIFTMTCDIEGKIYLGQGKSKKDAKKQAAIEALKEVYNINY